MSLQPATRRARRIAIEAHWEARRMRHGGFNPKFDGGDRREAMELFGLTEVQSVNRWFHAQTFAICVRYVSHAQLQQLEAAQGEAGSAEEVTPFVGGE